MDMDMDTLLLLPIVDDDLDWNSWLDGIATDNIYSYYRDNPDFLADVFFEGNFDFDFNFDVDVMPELEDVVELYSEESCGGGGGAGAHAATNGVAGVDETGARMRVSASSCGRGSQTDESQNSRYRKRKTRMAWTSDLHKRFEEVVETWGVDNAVPSKILKEMGDESLTRDQIASHLQKYRDCRNVSLTRKKEASSRNQIDLRSTTDAAALVSWAEAAVATEEDDLKLLSEPPPQHYCPPLLPSMYYHSSS